jgi:polyhydroxybutyrate depolymerase
MRRLLAILVLLGLAPACSGGDDAAESPPTTIAADCTPARPAPSGATTRAITSQGEERTYVLHVPRRYDGRTALPLVLNFHGYGSSAAQQMAYSLFAPLAEREGFVVAAPEGQGSPRHFNFLAPAPGETDDVVLATDLVDRVADDLCIDAARVYAAGMSNGGVMAFALACRADDRFAAFGAVAALVWSPQCEQARPVPVIGFAGTADTVVPFAGGEVNCCGRPRIAAAADTMANWARHNRCRPAPAESSPVPSVRLLRYEGCAPGGAVDFYVVQGGGHVWPGAPLSRTNAINATTVLWRFFAAHPRVQSQSDS